MSSTGDLCAAEGKRRGDMCVFGGTQVLDGADVFLWAVMHTQAWPGGERGGRGPLPAVHQEQLNTARAGFH